MSQVLLRSSRTKHSGTSSPDCALGLAGRGYDVTQAERTCGAESGSGAAEQAVAAAGRRGYAAAVRKVTCGQCSRTASRYAAQAKTGVSTSAGKNGSESCFVPRM